MLIVFVELKPKKGIDYSRDHLRRKWKAGEFPAPVSISDRRIAWIESEVDDWIAARIAKRDAGKACDREPAESSAKPVKNEARSAEAAQ
jgi:predicted DNA-binding transcriptional regulator AlpA